MHGEYRNEDFSPAELEPGKLLPWRDYIYWQAIKVFITGKQTAARTARRGKKIQPPPPIVLQGFLSLKNGRIPTWGPEKWGLGRLYF